MNEKHRLAKAKQADNRLPKLIVRAKFIISIVSLAILCASAVAQEKTADDWAKKGEELLGNGSIDEAANAYEKALMLYNESIEQNPKDTKALLGKAHVLDAMALIKNKGYNETILAFDKVLNVDPKSIEALIFKGRSIYNKAITEYPIQEREKFFADAVKAFDKAIEMDSKNVQARFERGFVTAQWGSLDEWMGKHEEAQNKWKESLKSCDNAIEILNQSVEKDQISFKGYLWCMKGFDLYQLGQYNESLQAYDNAIELDFPLAWDGKARTLSELGMYNESLEAFDKARERNPESLLSTIRKGMLLLVLGKNETALEAFNQAIEINSNYEKAWEGKGTALDRLGRHEEASKAYEEALVHYNESIKQEPGDVKAWTDKGNFLNKIGRHEEAVKIFDRAIDIVPDFSPAWQGKGDALKSLGRNSEADIALAKAKELGYNVSLKNLLYGPTL